MKINIDKTAGFCPGVVRAIKTAEAYLENKTALFCLGDIVHNPAEINRLSEIGLKTICSEKFAHLNNEKVLLRSHGEPPETYQIAEKNGVEIIDATCTIVGSLQRKIRMAYRELQNRSGSVIIYGKKDHPEVIGLNGQCNNKAIVVESLQDVVNIRVMPPFEVFSQTTKNPEDYRRITEALKDCFGDEKINVHDSICKWMKNRKDSIIQFAKENEMVIFVAGRKSSNGKYLYSLLKSENPQSYFISNPDEINYEWIEGKDRTGISGATSTPKWLLEQVFEKLESL